MPITSFTIGGPEVNALFETFEIRETSGAVSTMICDVVSVGSPVQRFDLHQPVVVEEDGVTIFAGTVTQTRESGFGGPNIYDADGAPQIVTSISCEDWGRIAQRVYVTATVADGTSLEAFLTTLVAGDLGDLGVTLHPSQAVGPALPAMTFTRTLASDVLTALTDATGYVSRIDYDKQLRMWAPGDIAAPFDINEDDSPARWTDDVVVEHILGDKYANRVTVVSDPITDDNHVESFTGDGSTSTFPLEWTFLEGRGYVTDDLAADPDINKTLTTTEFDGSADWTIHTETTPHTLERKLGPLPLGQVASITFKGTFQAEARAEDAPSIADPDIGLYAYVEQRKDITTTAAAQAIADALLAERLNAGDHIVTYDTRYTAPTLRAGQQQTLAASARNISGAHLITDMRVRAETPVTDEYATSGLGLIRTITAKRNNLGDKWQGTYHDWLERGGQGGSVSVESGGVPGTVGPAPPDTSVQSNQGGRFYGKESFVFLAQQNSLVVGDLSSITAADFESCQVFGYDCHITD